MDVEQLLAKVRAWQEADKAHREAYVAYADAPEGERKQLWEAMQDALKKRSYALQALQCDWMDTAKLFVTLADALHAARADAETAPARIAAALAIERMDTTEALGYQTDYANGYNDCRDAFLKVLKGE